MNRFTGRSLMPAEWAPHRATWIAWPHNSSDWPGRLQLIRWWYVEFVRHLATVEQVAIVFRSEAERRQAFSSLSKAGVSHDRLEAHLFPTNRSWLRDSGGTFVLYNVDDTTEPGLAMIDWHFNGWSKYADWNADNQLPTLIAAELQLQRITPRLQRPARTMVLEGGSIDVNGEGVALATEQCLLDTRVQPRNPGLGRSATEQALRNFLGIETVVWLGAGIAGDDTHGHVDDIARFVSPETVVVAVEPDRTDSNHGPLADNLARLRNARVHGRPFTIVTLPMPRPLWFDGQRLPASYLNFYLANGSVLVPTFNDPADRFALGTLAELFPKREVIGIHAVDLVLGLGTIHCLTLQEPAVP